MTQARMFGRVYYIDCSSLMELENRHVILSPGKTPTFSKLEQGLIWEGLEVLADEGRLKLIKQVRAELQRWHPVALARLNAFAGCRVPPTNNDLRRRYQTIVATYPRWAKKVVQSKYEPADPWLIASTQKYGGILITEELPAARQLRPRKNRPKIPDACEALGVPYQTLREVALEEGWLT